jgi:cardiolipin synthase
MQELGRMIKKLCSKLFSRIVITGVLILIQAAWFWSLFTSLSSYAHWLNPLMIALSVIMCAVLIRQDSTAPEFKISWMVLFMIMPVQGGLLYLLWGDKRPAFRLRKKLDWAYDRIRPLRRTDPAAQAMLEQANPPVPTSSFTLREKRSFPICWKRLNQHRNRSFWSSLLSPRAKCGMPYMMCCVVKRLRAWMCG